MQVWENCSRIVSVWTETKGKQIGIKRKLACGTESSYLSSAKQSGEQSMLYDAILEANVCNVVM